LLRNDIREVFGIVKALINLLFERQPKYLGQPIPINVESKN
jgi:vancomycin permeability regulator SanA